MIVWTHAAVTRPSRQDGTSEFENLRAAVMVEGDMSVVAVGLTYGSFSGVLHGGYDMAVVKLNAASGTEIWRYQVWADGCCSVLSR